MKYLFHYPILVYELKYYECVCKFIFIIICSFHFTSFTTIYFSPLDYLLVSSNHFDIWDWYYLSCGNFFTNTTHRFWLSHVSTTFSIPSTYRGCIHKPSEKSWYGCPVECSTYEWISIIKGEIQGNIIHWWAFLLMMTWIDYRNFLFKFHDPTLVTIVGWYYWQVGVWTRMRPSPYATWKPIVITPFLSFCGKQCTYIPCKKRSANVLVH